MKGRVPPCGRSPRTSSSSSPSFLIAQSQAALAARGRRHRRRGVEIGSAGRLLAVQTERGKSRELRTGRARALAVRGRREVARLLEVAGGARHVPGAHQLRREVTGGEGVSGRCGSVGGGFPFRGLRDCYMQRISDGVVWSGRAEVRRGGRVILLESPRGGQKLVLYVHWVAVSYLLDLIH